MRNLSLPLSLHFSLSPPLHGSKFILVFVCFSFDREEISMVAHRWLWYVAMQIGITVCRKGIWFDLSRPDLNLMIRFASIESKFIYWTWNHIYCELCVVYSVQTIKTVATTVNGCAPLRTHFFCIELDFWLVTAWEHGRWRKQPSPSVCKWYYNFFPSSPIDTHRRKVNSNIGCDGFASQFRPLSPPNNSFFGHVLVQILSGMKSGRQRKIR